MWFYWEVERQTGRLIAIRCTLVPEIRKEQSIRNYSFWETRWRTLSAFSGVKTKSESSPCVQWLQFRSWHCKRKSRRPVDCQGIKAGSIQRYHKRKKFCTERPEALHRALPSQTQLNTAWGMHMSKLPKVRGRATRRLEVSVLCSIESEQYLSSPARTVPSQWGSLPQGWAIIRPWLNITTVLPDKSHQLKP